MSPLRLLCWCFSLGCFQVNLGFLILDRLPSEASLSRPAPVLLIKSTHLMKLERQSHLVLEETRSVNHRKPGPCRVSAVPLPAPKQLLSCGDVRPLGLGHVLLHTHLHSSDCPPPSCLPGTRWGPWSPSTSLALALWDPVWAADRARLHCTHFFPFPVPSRLTVCLGMFFTGTACPNLLWFPLNTAVSFLRHPSGVFPGFLEESFLLSISDASPGFIPHPEASDGSS